MTISNNWYQSYKLILLLSTSVPFIRCMISRDLRHQEEDLDLVAARGDLLSPTFYKGDPSNNFFDFAQNNEISNLDSDIPMCSPSLNENSELEIFEIRHSKR